MSIIEFEALAKTFRTRERAAGLAGSLRSFFVYNARVSRGNASIREYRRSAAHT